MFRPHLPVEFHVERFFAKYEFTTKYLICQSDTEPLMMKEVVDMADDECREMWDNLQLCYTHADGHPLLREEIAKLYDNADKDDVLVLVPQEGIFVAQQGIMEYIRQEMAVECPHVIAVYPAYQSLYEFLRVMKCDLDYWFVNETSEGWKFSMDELRAMIRDDTKFIVANFPHNPTGCSLSKEEWQELIDLCAERKIMLFSDEMYRLTNNDGTQPLDGAFTMYENAVSLSGMSKAFALPGVRIGWLCTKNIKLMKIMQSLRDYITICGPAPSEILSIIGLRNRNKVLARTMDVLKTNLQHFNEFFKEFPDEFQWYPPTAGTTGLLRVKGWLLKLGKGGASGFCDVLVKSCQVLFLPSSAFNYTDCFVRASFARRNLPEALDVLRSFLKKHKPMV